jgi:prepilin-type processing-associated H-X9-DG protein
VVIAIIGVLVALLLPAVQAAREASRRTDCINKLHQLGLAIQNYENAHKRLPPGQTGNDPTKNNIAAYNDDIPKHVEAPFVVFVLPYLEENNTFAQYDFDKDVQEQYNSPGTPVGKRLPSFQCPSDEPQDGGACSGSAGEDWKGNYGINWGAYVTACQRPLVGVTLNELGATQGDCPAPRAMLHVAPFHIEYGAKLQQITDGLSNTLAMMEMIQTESEAGGVCDRRARIWNEKPGCYTITTRNLPNSASRDEGNCRTDLAYAPCNDLPNQATARTDSHIASRSRHPGGVAVLLCDGSAHFMNENVELSVWRALSTIDGEEVFTSPF